MMIGPIVNSGSLVAGAFTGLLFGRWLPERIKTLLPVLLGVITIGLAAPLISRADALHVVTLALIAGSFIGELLQLEKHLDRLLKRLMAPFFKRNTTTPHDDDFYVQYVTLITLFCFGSLGFFGAIEEGMSGQPGLLLTKSILDFTTALIFAIVLGPSIALIALPQFALLAGFYLAAGYIVPLTNEAMLNDFAATAGMIFIATGLRMCNLMSFPIINTLPALLLVFFLTRLWQLL